jgi:purine-nucleoside phosphorylase
MIEPDGFVSLLRPYLFGRGFRLPRRAIVGFRYMGWLLRQVKERPSFRQHRWPEPGDVLMDFLYRGRRIAYLNLQALGGPLAAWGVETLIALGVKEVILLGSSGALIKEIGRGDLILPAAAVREEGTSYHYLPPDQAVHASPRLRGHLEDVMDRLGIAYHQGDVWTTDAFFRETWQKVERFRSDGVVCVDMEAASLFAVAQYRGIDLACLFYGGDSLAEESWDLRLAGEMHPHQLRMLEIACRALVDG